MFTLEVELLNFKAEKRRVMDLLTAKVKMVFNYPFKVKIQNKECYLKLGKERVREIPAHQHD